MNDGEISLAYLAKKIDDQSRFTRSVVVICTLAILGMAFYSLTEMFSSLPSVVVLHFMANIDNIVHEWNQAQSNNSKHEKPLPNTDGSAK